MARPDEDSPVHQRKVNIMVHPTPWRSFKCTRPTPAQGLAISDPCNALPPARIKLSLPMCRFIPKRTERFTDPILYSIVGDWSSGWSWSCSKTPTQSGKRCFHWIILTNKSPLISPMWYPTPTPPAPHTVSEQLVLTQIDVCFGERHDVWVLVVPDPAPEP